jgi:ribosome maturation factor RimP
MLMPDPEDPVFRDLDAFIQTLGLSLVELSLRTKNGTANVQIVLHSSSGLGIDECSKAHRQLIPRLETLLKTEDLSVEVGSPGLERNLKYLRELNLYCGKKAKFYLAGGKDWEAGTIESVGDEDFVFQTVAGPKTVLKAAIQKAKLNDIS